jgi:integrase
MARQINKLTDRQVTKLTEPGRFHDGLGLYLQVFSSTSRSWLLRYERSGKERWMGLGKLADFDLSEARERAKRERQKLADGIDPIEARWQERDKARKNELENITFKAAAQKYLTLHEPTWRNAKHRAQWRSTLETHAFPTLGSRPVRVIDAMLINAAVEPIWNTTHETAQRTRQRIERICQWVRDGMPLPTSNGARHVNHHAALDWRAIPQFTAELRRRDRVSSRALEFLILTAARTGEVIGARWSEIKSKVWTIPAERMKAHKEHSIPLSVRALEILNGLPREKGNDFVFIGGVKGKGLSSMAMLELLRGLRPDDGLTVHGFRSAFSDWAHEQTAHANYVIEMALAHTIKNKVEAAYRRGDLLAKRSRLMADWARYCASPPIETGADNVTPIRAKA